MFSFLRWGVNADLSLCHAPETVTTASGRPLAAVVASELPASRRIRLSSRLFNGVLQTIAYASDHEQTKHQQYFLRELVVFKDGGQCLADYAVATPEDPAAFEAQGAETLPEGYPKLHPRTRYMTGYETTQLHDGMEPLRPLLVILHGMAGGSHEPVIRSVCEKLRTEMDVVVLNLRGCARTPITTPELYCSKSTGDIREFVARVHARFPNKPVYAAGFSFGGMVLGNYLVEEGSECPLKGAITVQLPWDMVSSFERVQLSWSGKYLLGPAVTKFLVRLVKLNRGPLQEKYPELVTDEQFAKAAKFRHTLDFDDAITAKLYGYESGMEYYRQTLPVHQMERVAVPLVAIYSNDDPVISELPRAGVEANPNIVMVESSLGGHLGFYQPDGESWLSLFVARTVHGMAGCSAQLLPEPESALP